MHRVNQEVLNRDDSAIRQNVRQALTWCLGVIPFSSLCERDRQSVSGECCRYSKTFSPLLDSSRTCASPLPSVWGILFTLGYAHFVAYSWSSWLSIALRIDRYLTTRGRFHLQVDLPLSTQVDSDGCCNMKDDLFRTLISLF